MQMKFKKLQNTWNIISWSFQFGPGHCTSFQWYGGVEMDWAHMSEFNPVKIMWNVYIVLRQIWSRCIHQKRSWLWCIPDPHWNSWPIIISSYVYFYLKKSSYCSDLCTGTPCVLFLYVLHVCAKLSPVDCLMNWSEQSVIVSFKLCTCFSQLEMVTLCITNRFRDGPEQTITISQNSGYLSALFIKEWP